MTGIELIIPAFIAGLFTFLAPCTLPLVPGYLGFISGVSMEEAAGADKRALRRKVMLNGLFYVLGFSAVFVLMGSLIGFVGSTVFASSRIWLSRVGGAFVILFGLFMLYQALMFYRDRWQWMRRVYEVTTSWPLIGSFNRMLSGEHRLHIRGVKPGNSVSSLIFGGAFAFGWTPCVGPVLGAILTLAATEATVAQGALLLAVFSAGLATPFLVLAAGWGSFTNQLSRINSILPAISAIGGVFIIILGALVLTNSIGLWIGFFFELFGFVKYERIYDFL